MKLFGHYTFSSLGTQFEKPCCRTQN